MSQVIQLPENLTIHYANEHLASLKTQVGEASTEVVFDGSSVETIDTSGIQLLLVMVSSLSEKGVKVGWQNVTESMASSMANLGLSQKLHFNNA
jgi:anti-anti-sigma regulatory factor